MIGINRIENEIANTYNKKAAKKVQFYCPLFSGFFIMLSVNRYN